MIAISKKNPFPQFPKAKISDAVKTILPKGKNFRVYVDDAKIGKMKIVRVVTPAWKSLRPAERIEKVIYAVKDKLTTKEQDRVLRYSVLTPDEYKDLVIFKVPHHGSAFKTTKAPKRRTKKPA